MKDELTEDELALIVRTMGTLQHTLEVKNFFLRVLNRAPYGEAAPVVAKIVRMHAENPE